MAALPAPTGGAAATPRRCAPALVAGRVSRQVRIESGGRPLPAPVVVAPGDTIEVRGHGTLLLRLPGGGRYLVRSGRMSLACEPVVVSSGRTPRTMLLAHLHAGSVSVAVAAAPVAVQTANGLAIGRHAGARYVVRRATNGRTSVMPSGRMLPVDLANVRHPAELRIDVRPAQIGLIDRHGLRLDTWPFALTLGERHPGPADGLVAFEADGLACSTGCGAPAQPGWPLAPFHRQHALRSGLNEIRPSGLHIGFDIQARDHQLVYAMESGVAHIVKSGGLDKGVVQVGQFQYWHLDLSVREGQPVRAYATPLGRVHAGFGHVHVSESAGGALLNVLRPGGRTLSPYSDTEAPVIGPPTIYRDGRVIVDAFDPQSFVTRIKYETPVLAPAALAYRLFDARGHAIGGLEWALRSTRHLDDHLRPVIFAPGAANPGFSCFALRRICRPRWRYWLAGGLAPTLPIGSLMPGRYRLAVYAYDYADNVTARDAWFSLGALRARPATVAAITARADP